MAESSGTYSTSNSLHLERATLQKLQQYNGLLGKSPRKDMWVLLTNAIFIYYCCEMKVTTYQSSRWSPSIGQQVSALA